jgi:hypothetical protein
MEVIVRCFRLFTCATTGPTPTAVGCPKTLVERVELTMYCNAARTSVKVGYHVVYDVEKVFRESLFHLIRDQGQ